MVKRFKVIAGTICCVILFLFTSMGTFLMTKALYLELTNYYDWQPIDAEVINVKIIRSKGGRFNSAYCLDVDFGYTVGHVTFIQNSLVDHSNRGCESRKRDIEKIASQIVQSGKYPIYYSNYFPSKSTLKVGLDRISPVIIIILVLFALLFGYISFIRLFRIKKTAPP